MALKWGFADSTHFSRRFRDAYGMSPREWRQFGQQHPGDLSPGAAYARQPEPVSERLSA